MRIAPDHPRLRIIAVACLALGAWLIIQSSQTALISQASLLPAVIFIAAALLLAVGIAFWLLGTDRRAGIVFDTKGLMLNLGHSAAFVSWDNIAAIGVTERRRTLLTIGSHRQLGIRLHRPAEYLQSYEARLPASRGVLAHLVRLIRSLLAPISPQSVAPTLAMLEVQRRKTGYDLLIPEAQLGGRAGAFHTIVETYRSNPQQRHSFALLKEGNPT